MRRCVGCGVSAPQAELVRFTAREGSLIESRTAPGRGAWTHRRADCFRRAVQRRGFARALRLAVRVDPDLARLYTEELDG